MPDDSLLIRVSTYGGDGCDDGVICVYMLCIHSLIDTRSAIQINYVWHKINQRHSPHEPASVGMPTMTVQDDRAALYPVHHALVLEQLPRPRATTCTARERNCTCQRFGRNRIWQIGFASAAHFAYTMWSYRSYLTNAPATPLDYLFDVYSLYPHNASHETTWCAKAPSRPISSPACQQAPRSSALTCTSPRSYCNWLANMNFNAKLERH